MRPSLRLSPFGRSSCLAAVAQQHEVDDAKPRNPNLRDSKPSSGNRTLEGFCCALEQNERDVQGQRRTGTATYWDRAHFR